MREDPHRYRRCPDRGGCDECRAAAREAGDAWQLAYWEAERG